MIGQTVARRYARAFFDLAKDQDAVAKYGDDLTLVVEAMGWEPALKRALHNPLVAVEDKKTLFQQAFGASVSETTLRFLYFLLDKGREQVLEAVLDEYRRLVNGYQNLVDAEAISAFALSEQMVNDLRQGLQKALGKEVNLKVSVDASLLGGLVLQVGDRRIDGSLRGRMRAMRLAIREGRIS